MTTTNISVFDGMLHFPSYEEVELVMHSLTDLSNDSLTTILALHQLGYGPDDIDAPEEPVYDLFNARFGVTTIRSTLEALEKIEEQLEDDEGVLPSDAISTCSPLLGSLINSAEEIRIKDLIYKYQDGNKAVVFQAEENDLLDLVRNTENFYDLGRRHNFFPLDNRKQEDLELYKKIENANRGSNCELDVVIVQNAGGYSITSTSYIPPGPQGEPIHWTVIDGNGSSIFQSFASNSFFFIPEPNTVYPLQVCLQVFNCEIKCFPLPDTPPSEYNCDLFDWDYEIVNGHTFEITATNLPTDVPVKWDFNGDGHIDYTWIYPQSETFIYEFDKDIEAAYETCATVSTNDCSKTVCKSFGTVGCGRKRDFAAKRRFRWNYAPGGNFNCRVVVWVNDRLFTTVVGAKNIHRWGGIRARADYLSIFWNSTATPGLGDFSYFKDCHRKEDQLLDTGFNKWVRKTREVYAFKLTIRDEDFKIRFGVEHNGIINQKYYPF